MESAWWGLSTQMALPDGLQIWKIKIFNENVVAVDKIVCFQKAKNTFFVEYHFISHWNSELQCINCSQLSSNYTNYWICRFTFVLDSYPEKNNNINVKHI